MRCTRLATGFVTFSCATRGAGVEARELLVSSSVVAIFFGNRMTKERKDLAHG